MKPNVRVEEYQEAPDTVSIGGIRWLTKWDVKVQFSDRDTAYAWKDRIEKLMTGEMAVPEQERTQSEWDNIPQAFRDWWNQDYDDSANPFRLASSAYYAWAGWQAAERLQPDGNVVGYVYSEKGCVRKKADVSAYIPNGTPLYIAPPPAQPISYDEWAAHEYTKVLNETIKDLSAKLAKYTQHPAKPLTLEQIWQMANDCTIAHDLHADKFARAIEAAHGIKEQP